MPKTKICPICGEESKALHFHMNKHKKDGVLPVESKVEVKEEIVGVSDAMVRDESKENIKTETEESEDDKVDAAILDLQARVLKLERIAGLLSATDKIQEAIDASPSDLPQAAPEEPSGDVQELKVHPRYRQLADGILGKQFKVWETYDVEPTYFQFHIQVPQELSPIPKGQGLDIRTRTIANSEGENGVKLWLELVRSNLNKFYSQKGVQSPFTSAVLE